MPAAFRCVVSGDHVFEQRCFWGVGWTEGQNTKNKRWWLSADAHSFLTSVASHCLRCFVCLFVFISCFFIHSNFCFSRLRLSLPFSNTRAAYCEWQLITTPSPHPLTSRDGNQSVFMRVCACVFPFLCLFEHKCGCISSPSAFMPCLPMLLFVSIFTFAYAVRYLSYAQAFQVSSHSLLLMPTHSNTHIHTHTVQRYAAHEYSQLCENPLIVSVPQWWLEKRTKVAGRWGWKWRQSAPGSEYDSFWTCIFFFFVLFIR